jgi:two-component system response regulator LytT
MYQIALCEDCGDDRLKAKATIAQVMKEAGVAYTITDFWSGEEFLRHAKPYMFDIAFFDVEMRRINGIETAKHLRETDRSVVIIFLTAYNDFVFSCFSAEPLQYLVKPPDYAMFKQTLMRAIQKVDKNKRQCYNFSFNGVSYRIQLKDIHYFSSLGRTVEVHCASGNYKFYAKLNEIEKDPLLIGFIRSHQSFLVNLDQICRVTKDEITLFSGETLPVSKNRAKEVRDSFWERVVSVEL